jgi:hypothetical protein
MNNVPAPPPPAPEEQLSTLGPLDVTDDELASFAQNWSPTPGEDDVDTDTGNKELCREEIQEQEHEAGRVNDDEPKSTHQARTDEQGRKRRGRPKHPVWQYFKALSGSRDKMQVKCKFCDAQEQERWNEKDPTTQKIPKIRSVISDMVTHLYLCPSCPRNLKEDMKTWPQVTARTTNVTRSYPNNNRSKMMDTTTFQKQSKRSSGIEL